jgi:uncharacterized protein YbjT (DUF2867 family)
LTKAALRQHYADLARMEDILQDSGLDWTIVRPPGLTDKPLTGTYRTAYGQNLRGGFFISRADVAHCMLRVLEQPETIKQVIGIAYLQGTTQRRITWCNRRCARRTTRRPVVGQRKDAEPR